MSIRCLNFKEFPTDNVSILYTSNDMNEKPKEEGLPIDSEALDLIVRGLTLHLTPGSRIIVDKSGQEIYIPEESKQDQPPDDIET